jgi:hypothetical protein
MEWPCITRFVLHDLFNDYVILVLNCTSTKENIMIHVERKINMAITWWQLKRYLWDELTTTSSPPVQFFTRVNIMMNLHSCPQHCYRKLACQQCSKHRSWPGMTTSECVHSDMCICCHLSHPPKVSHFTLWHIGDAHITYCATRGVLL